MGTKRVIEINGVKVEVDLREAVELHTYRVGDPVRVLVKKYSAYEVKSGVIIGFENFRELPTIAVAYLEESYNDADLKVVFVNDTQKEIEITPLYDKAELGLSKNRVLQAFDRQVQKKQKEIEEIEEKRNYFLSRFGCYMEQATEALQ